MRAQTARRSAGRGRQRRMAFRLAAAATLVALGACSGPPVLPEAADPAAPVPPVSYRSTVAPYVSRRPVEPRPWLEQNRGVAPAEKP